MRMTKAKEVVAIIGGLVGTGIARFRIPHTDITVEYRNKEYSFHCGGLTVFGRKVLDECDCDDVIDIFDDGSPIIGSIYIYEYPGLMNMAPEEIDRMNLPSGLVEKICAMWEVSE